MYTYEVVLPLGQKSNSSIFRYSKLANYVIVQIKNRSIICLNPIGSNMMSA